MRQHRGQATVETIILLPLALLLGVAAWQGVLIGWTAVEAQDAARQAARARLSGEPVEQAAAAALPGSMRDGLTVETGRQDIRLRVHVPAIVPGLALSVTASAPAVEG